jgi:hypothetical protein
MQSSSCIFPDVKLLLPSLIKVNSQYIIQLLILYLFPSVLLNQVYTSTVAVNFLDSSLYSLCI